MQRSSSNFCNARRAYASSFCLFAHLVSGQTVVIRRGRGFSFFHFHFRLELADDTLEIRTQRRSVGLGATIFEVFDDIARKRKCSLFLTWMGDYGHCFLS